MQTQAGNTVVLESASFPGGTPTATDPVCLDQTTKLLQEHGLATPAELHQLREHGLAPPQGPRPWDPLEFLAALRAPDPDVRSLEVEQLGRALSQVMGQQLALVPFASRLPTPSAFYDLNESLLAECKRMMTPVPQAQPVQQPPPLPGVSRWGVILCQEFIKVDASPLAFRVW